MSVILLFAASVNTCKSAAVYSIRFLRDSRANTNFEQIPLDL